MEQNSLEIALEHYKTALDALKPNDATLTKAQALKILIARDTLQKAIEKEIQISPHLWIELVEQDERLKKEAHKITESIDLVKYRDTLATSSQAWWWQLKISEPTHPWNKYDGIWRVLRVIVWTGNLGLLSALATRFLSGGSGFWEAAAIAFPGILTLLQAQGELTETGRKEFERLLAKLKVKPHLYEEAKLGTSLVITGLLLFSFFQIMPFCSKYYMNQGKQHENKEDKENKENKKKQIVLNEDKENKKEQIALAEKDYLKAIALDPENLEAHYLLATLYSKLQDFDNARKHYIIAVKGGKLEAYIDLTYWYIRQNKAAEAAYLLEYDGSRLLNENQNQEEQDEEDKAKLQNFKYHFYKNLGWARFKQKRYEEAKNSLNIATNLANDPQIFVSIRNPGAAYCLTAQVLEQIQKPKISQPSTEIKENWRKCRDLIKDRRAPGDRINIEEDMWLYQAKQKLKEK